MTVARDGAPILRGVSLELPSGAATAVVGPSGAGKTTLVRAIAGLDPLAGGEILLDGRSLAGVPSHRRRVAVVFQEPRLLPHLDVVDNVALGLRAAGVGRRRRREQAAEMLAEVGLAGLRGRDVAGLSGGEQQRVALARALCVDPALLLLDEPLAAVDPNRREGLRRLIAELRDRRGVTTLLVTHDRAEAAELGDRIALLLEGRVVQHDVPEALFRRPASAAVARFFGAANVLRGVVERGRLHLGDACVDVPGADGEATLVVRPEDVHLDDASALRLTVEEATFVGAHVRLRLVRPGLSLEAHVPVGDAPPAGTIVGVRLAPADLWRIPGNDPAPTEREAGQPS
ncbi:MAG: ABC transporter ATP-binding protein [Thermoleophilia bacterium]